MTILSGVGGLIQESDWLKFTPINILFTLNFKIRFDRLQVIYAHFRLFRISILNKILLLISF